MTQADLGVLTLPENASVPTLTPPGHACKSRAAGAASPRAAPEAHTQAKAASLSAAPSLRERAPRVPAAGGWGTAVGEGTGSQPPGEAPPGEGFVEFGKGSGFPRKRRVRLTVRIVFHSTNVGFVRCEVLSMRCCGSLGCLAWVSELRGGLVHSHRPGTRPRSLAQGREQGGGGVWRGPPWGRGPVCTLLTPPESRARP